jgi:hypothetical protein
VEGQAALAFDRPGSTGDDLDLVALGRIEAAVGPGEHLVRPDDIEGLEPGEGDDHDAVHGARVPHRRDGVNDDIPTFPATTEPPGEGPFGS